MKYEAISGWFDFQDIYDQWVEECPQEGTIVEVGAYRGRSTLYLAEKIATLRPDIKFYTVDTWEGSPEHKVKGLDKNLKQDFLDNLVKAGLADYVRPLNIDSVRASRAFTFKTVFATFIDANHETNDVIQDLKHWLPRTSVYLAGHDYTTWPTVATAVKAFAIYSALTFEIRGSSFMFKCR